jgi:hypothetical protein
MTDNYYPFDRLKIRSAGTPFGGPGFIRFQAEGNSSKVFALPGEEEAPERIIFRF